MHRQPVWRRSLNAAPRKSHIAIGDVIGPRRPGDKRQHASQAQKAHFLMASHWRVSLPQKSMQSS